MILNTAVYSAQTVIYYHTGKFLHPTGANGVVAQSMTGLVHFLCALIFVYLGQEDKDIAQSIRWGFFILNVIIVRDPLMFYYTECGDFSVSLANHMKYIGSSTIVLSFFAMEWMTMFPYMAVQSAICFRLTGTSILKTVVGGTYDHFDLGLGVWILTAPFTVYYVQAWNLDMSAMALTVYLVARNSMVMASEYSKLL